jgi:hypothetical protein
MRTVSRGVYSRSVRQDPGRGSFWWILEMWPGEGGNLTAGRVP